MNSNYFYGSFRVTRITEDMKIRSGAYINYNEDIYRFDEDTVKNIG
jgi:hypothetical protein